MTKNTTRETTSREVNFFLSGLFYFSFPDSMASSSPYKRSDGNVGILSTRRGANRDHDLFVRYKDAGQLSDYITIPHSVLSTLAPENIVIDKSTPATSPDVTIRGFDGPTGWGKEPADRNNPNGGDKYDFKWIIDFEGPRLHICDQQERPGSLRPNLQFKTGDFYTKKISDNKYNTFKTGETRQPFGYAAEIQGVKIALNAAEHLVIKLPGAETQVRDTITEIYLFNMRPEHVPDLSKQPENAKSHQHGGVSPLLVHDDSEIYYSDLLDRIAEPDRFHFEPAPPIMKSPPFICFGSGGSGGE